MPKDIRWQQRFQNLDRALTLLREPIARDIATLSDLEKAGTVQRFELAVELSWKTLKDFLEHEGEIIAPVTPRNVVKTGFSARVLADGQVWIDMLDHRNLLAHTYDETVVDAALCAIRDRYLEAMEALHAWLQVRRDP